MNVPGANRLRELEGENAELTKLLAESHLDNHALVLMQIAGPGRANFSVLRGFASPEHRIPDCRRNSALDAQTSDCQRAFAYAMHHFDGR